MSTGPRIYHARAMAAAGWLMRLWKIQGSGYRIDTPVVVGSLLRGVERVGDIDLTAPLPPPGAIDQLYLDVAGTLELPAAADEPEQPVQSPGLFGDAPAQPNPHKSHPKPAISPRPVGVAGRGLKPGFRCASMTVRLRGDGGDNPATGRVELPVQIHRYVDGPEGNAGWTVLRATGPADFGKAMLTLWKAEHGIPLSDEAAKGSINGFLVDAAGTPIPTPDEASIFRRLNVEYIPPAGRDEATARVLMRRATNIAERARVC